eukprot:Phypoly_transcript_01894.p1 GENE.Phypoly_transcript_01894~~Phypoly_transcript_01894.p1  ORF type:complete len:789 (+),score=99.81 Phypoly_transcript_01894:138-2369(+)
MANIRDTDSHKKELVQLRGETLIQVPCWWDGDSSSFAATIHFERPDLEMEVGLEKCSPISLNYIPGYFPVVSTVPDIGELMLASFPLPSDNFSATISPANSWWLGEKYDGIRCCWHPTRSRLYSRAGLVFHLHSSFTVGVKSFLDAEIWFGRGAFLDTQKIISSEMVDWPHLRIIAFDDPNDPLRLPFEDRYLSVLANVPAEHCFINVAVRSKCTKRRKLAYALRLVLEDGGEGIVLRKPASLYENGRSNNLYKLKAARGDMEVLVLAVDHDTCTTKMPTGEVLEVPNTDDVHLQRGDIVTVSYENFARRATLVNPKIVRIRKDISWEEVLRSYSDESGLNDTSRKVMGFTSKPAGFWSSGNGQNIREFFENFAKARDFDPLGVENWYSLSTEFMKSKGGRYIVGQFKGGFAEALQQVFPEIYVDKGKFSLLPKHYWASVANRKQVLLDFAAQYRFDPLVAINWYNAPINEIYENSRSMLNFYGHSVTRALMHLFPDISFRPHLFANLPPKYWTEPANQKQFFLDFAKDRKFDPFVAKNWYSISLELFRATKRSGSVLAHYDGNLKKALFALFPNIGLEKSQFKVLPSKYWLSIENRRSIFLQFSKQAGFDPLVPENWYSVPAEEIRKIQHAKSMLYYYGGSVVRALLHLFPTVKFDPSKFLFLPKTFWQDPTNRRNFFIDFADRHNFDPLLPSNWYRVSLLQLQQTKYFATILKHERAALPHALVNLFPDIGLDLRKFSLSK